MAHLHSKGAKALLARYRIGQLEGSGAAKGPVLPAADLIDESKPLLPQVGWGMGGWRGERAGSGEWLP